MIRRDISYKYITTHLKQNFVDDAPLSYFLTPICKKMLYHFQCHNQHKDFSFLTLKCFYSTNVCS